MKILHLIDHLGLGGAQVVASEIVEHSNSAKIKKMRLEAVAAHSFFKFDPVSPLFFFYQLIKKNKFNIIHCHLTKSLFVGIMMKFLFGKKITLIYHEHGASAQNNSFFHTVLINISPFFVDKYIVISRYSKQSLLQHIGEQHTDSVYLHHNFVAPQFFTEKNKTNKKTEKSPMKIGFSGRIHYVKGWKTFIEAITAIVKQKDIKIKGIIAGSGPEEVQLQKLISKKKYVDYVGRVGFKKMPAFYQKLDFIVVPSFQESMGLTHLEAQASGIPVIVSNIPALRETVSTENALLFDPHSKDELVAVIMKMVTDKKLRAKLISRGLANSKKYTIKQYLTTLTNDIYKI